MMYNWLAGVQFLEFMFFNVESEFLSLFVCTPTGAARKHLTTVTDVCLLNYAVSLDEARDGTQKNTQGVLPCKLPIDSLPLQQLGL